MIGRKEPGADGGAVGRFHALLSLHTADRWQALRLSLAALGWVALVAVSLAWNLGQAVDHRNDLALQTARSFFQLLVLTRRWNADHGGVYVPVTPDTQPNPYLDGPQRDVRVAPDLTLTKINPAYMTRQLDELATNGPGVQFHITSLDPIRPANAPEPWEAAALRRFATGVDEVWESPRQEGERYRYMAPLYAERPCLACHEDEHVGDVRGGISITLPELAPLPLRALLLSHGLVAAAGLALILVTGRMLGRAHHRLRREALFDALTGIPNRRFFIDQLTAELRYDSLPLVVVMGDIDYFKNFNDAFGHQAGDEALRSVAGVLRDAVRRSGDFYARYGGEEFVVILPQTSLEAALRIAESIRRGVADLRLPHPRSPFGVVTMSLGVAVQTECGCDGDALVRTADQSLYDAKAAGRNQVAVRCGTRRTGMTDAPAQGAQLAGVAR
ncbi:GGDEF domain-containing protein [Thiohalocapsa halophila]|nr:diguanylate cyclase [Thiohalocapsa halophila]